MKRARNTLAAILTGGVLVALPAARGAGAAAQGPSAAPGASRIEAGGFYHHVSDGFGSWRGGYARAVLDAGRNVWYADARIQEAFRDRGAYGALTNVHTFSTRLYTQLAAGAGTGDYVFPEFRLDAALTLKLGGGGRVLATAGGGYVESKSVFEDYAVHGAVGWYAGPGALLELGGRVNWSDPGAVRSARGQVALTLGRPGRAELLLRGGAGTEGYQLIGAEETLRRFRSQEAGLVWRQWLSRRGGLVLGAEWYHNPFYTRAGISLGAFGAW